MATVALGQPLVVCLGSTSRWADQEAERRRPRRTRQQVLEGGRRASMAQSRQVTRRSQRLLGWTTLLAVLVSGLVTVATSSRAEAGIFFNDVEYTYKEYWASHATFTGGCGENEKPAPSWYIEPEQGCTKSIELEIGDDVSGAIAAVMYVDLWRNRRPAPHASHSTTVRSSADLRRQLLAQPVPGDVPLFQLRARAPTSQVPRGGRRVPRPRRDGAGVLQQRPPDRRRRPAVTWIRRRGS